MNIVPKSFTWFLFIIIFIIISYTFAPSGPDIDFANWDEGGEFPFQMFHIMILMTFWGRCI